MAGEPGLEHKTCALQPVFAPHFGSCCAEAHGDRAIGPGQRIVRCGIQSRNPQRSHERLGRRLRTRGNAALNYRSSPDNGRSRATTAGSHGCGWLLIRSLRARYAQRKVDESEIHDHRNFQGPASTPPGRGASFIRVTGYASIALAGLRHGNCSSPSTWAPRLTPRDLCLRWWNSRRLLFAHRGEKMSG